MRIFYDTEFIDNGKTIDLISIGMVAENGDTFYRESRDFDHDAFSKRPWLVENVMPGLYTRRANKETLHMAQRIYGPALATDAAGNVTMHDFYPPEVVSRANLREQITSWLFAHADPNGVELWAYFSAYDHVALAQIFGAMIDMAGGLPMYTNDIMTLYTLTKIAPPHYVEEKDKHNALVDAQEVKQQYEYYMRFIDRSPK